MISAGSTLFAATRARPRDLEKARKSQDPPARKQPTLRWKDYLSIFSVIITCPLVWIAVLKCVLSPLDACHMMIQRFDGNFCRSAMDSETVIVFRADQGPTCQAWSDEGRNASYTAIQLEDADPEKLGDDMRRGWKGDVFGVLNVTPHCSRAVQADSSSCSDQCSLKMFESADCSGEPMAYIPVRSLVLAEFDKNHCPDR